MSLNLNWRNQIYISFPITILKIKSQDPFFISKIKSSLIFYVRPHIKEFIPTNNRRPVATYKLLTLFLVQFYDWAFVIKVWNEMNNVVSCLIRTFWNSSDHTLKSRQNHWREQPLPVCGTSATKKPSLELRNKIQLCAQFDTSEHCCFGLLKGKYIYFILDRESFENEDIGCSTNFVISRAAVWCEQKEKDNTFFVINFYFLNNKPSMWNLSEQYGLLLIRLTYMYIFDLQYMTFSAAML